MHFHKHSHYLKYFAKENQTTHEWVHLFLSLSKELCLVRMKEQVSSYLQWDSLLVTPQNIRINLFYFIEFCVYIKNKTKQKHGKNIKTYHQDANIKQWPAHSSWWVQKCFREVIFSFPLTVYVQNSKGCFSFYEAYKPATVSFACLSKCKCNSMKLRLFSYIQSHLTNHPNCQINHCIINVSCVMSLKN